MSSALTLLLTLTGCVAAADLPDGVGPVDGVSPLCADSLPPGDVVVIADGFDAGTRGIAFSPEGRLFVTTADTVEEVEPSGDHAPVGQVPEAAGLEWWSAALAVVSRDIGDADGAGAVYLLDPDVGEPSIFVRPLPGAEAATRTPWRSLVVASPVADEEIVEVLTNGGLDGFIQQVPSPFGVGFAPDASAVWVASLLAEPSTLLRFPLDGEEPMQPESFATWGGGSGASEIVVSTTDSAVYVALAGEGRVARIAPDTGEETDIVDGVDGVTGLALGVAPWDPCALYMTSPSSGELLAVGLSR